MKDCIRDFDVRPFTVHRIPGVLLRTYQNRYILRTIFPNGVHRPSLNFRAISKVIVAILENLNRWTQFRKVFLRKQRLYLCRTLLHSSSLYIRPNLTHSTYYQFYIFLISRPKELKTLIYYQTVYAIYTARLHCIQSYENIT